MSHTKLSIDGERFLINGALTYSEIPDSKPSSHGLLMNARFIQGIFDSENRALFHRYGKIFDPDQNTDELIAALPQWYAKGLRAITVGMQGGGACFTIDGSEMKNNPYSEHGTVVDPAYLDRLLRIIKACDELGMVVIVSCFYGFNTAPIKDAEEVMNIIQTMALFLKNCGYDNLIMEVANEHNLPNFEHLPILHEPEGIVALIRLIRSVAPSLPVGCSGGGGYLNDEVCRASDVVLIHGNGETRSQLYNQIRKAKSYAPNRPIVVNEDSQAIGHLAVCEETYCSWGYYNNMTKQEPPTYWEITRGEDEFFAWRMADMIGIPQEPIPAEKQYYLEGFEEHMHYNGMRYPRLASLYPETINFVRFYENGTLVYTCYEESFLYDFHDNWSQGGVLTKDGDEWEAHVHLHNGEVVILKATVKNA